jgi:hypothetical protein
MTEVAPPPSPVDPQARESRRAEASARSMQQRLEWERAFLKAQPREESGGSTETSHAAGSETARTPGDAKHAGHGAHTDEAPSIAARAPARAAAPSPSTARAAGTTAGAVQLPEASPPATVASARSAREARPSRLEAAPRRPAAPPQPPQTSEREPATFGVYRDERGVRLWMRDAGIGREAGARIAQRLRRMLGRLGVRLASFTLNGTRLLRDEGPGAGSDAGRARDPELELDNFY